MYEDVVALTQGNGRVESKRARRGVVGCVGVCVRECGGVCCSV